jgi:hypothetical protein
MPLSDSMAAKDSLMAVSALPPLQPERYDPNRIVHEYTFYPTAVELQG